VITKTIEHLVDRSPKISVFLQQLHF